MISVAVLLSTENTQMWHGFATSAGHGSFAKQNRGLEMISCQVLSQALETIPATCYGRHPMTLEANILTKPSRAPYLRYFLPLPPPRPPFTRP